MPPVEQTPVLMDACPRLSPWFLFLLSGTFLFFPLSGTFFPSILNASLSYSMFQLNYQFRRRPFLLNLTSHPNMSFYNLAL